MVSEPTWWALCYSVADCLSGVRTYLPGTVLQWWRLFWAMTESTCRALCYSGKDCLSCVRTYLPGTVLQGCRLFKRCQNLPTGHCVTVVQTVKAVSEPTCRAQCYSGEGCISNVRVYLPGTGLQWRRLFKRCRNLPAGHCVTVMQAVWAISEITCRALCSRGADCLSGVGTYLPGTVLQW